MLETLILTHAILRDAEKLNIFTLQNLIISCFSFLTRINPKFELSDFAAIKLMG